MSNSVRFVRSVPARLWNRISTGAPRSRQASCVLMWASTQICVGAPVLAAESVEMAQHRGDVLDGVDRRVDADQGVAGAERQAPVDQQRDAAQVVGRMVRLQARRERARAGPAACAPWSDADDLAGDEDQLVHVAQLGDRRRP